MNGWRRMAGDRRWTAVAAVCRDAGMRCHVPATATVNVCNVAVARLKKEKVMAVPSADSVKHAGHCDIQLIAAYSC